MGDIWPVCLSACEENKCAKVAEWVTEVCTLVGQQKYLPNKTTFSQLEPRYSDWVCFEQVTKCKTCTDRNFSGPYTWIKHETSEGQMTHPTEQQSVPKDTCVSSQCAQGTHMQVDNVSWEEDICRICKLFASSAETWACAKGETVPTCFLQDSLKTAECVSLATGARNHFSRRKLLKAITEREISGRLASRPAGQLA